MRCVPLQYSGTTQSTFVLFKSPSDLKVAQFQKNCLMALLTMSLSLHQALTQFKPPDPRTPNDTSHRQQWAKMRGAPEVKFTDCDTWEQASVALATGPQDCLSPRKTLGRVQASQPKAQACNPWVGGGLRHRQTNTRGHFTVKSFILFTLLSRPCIVRGPDPGAELREPESDALTPGTPGCCTPAGSH